VLPSGAAGAGPLPWQSARWARVRKEGVRVEDATGRVLLTHVLVAVLCLQAVR